MALITSSILSQASGKLGQLVFSHNSGSMQIRKKSSFGKNGSCAQSLQRSQMSDLSRLWKTLSDDQRVSWIALASQISFTNNIGSSYKLSGSGLFNKLNRNLLLCDNAPIVIAPSINSKCLPKIDCEIGMHLGINNIDGLMCSSCSAFGINYGWVISFSGPVSSGISKPNNYKITSVYKVGSLNGLFLIFPYLKVFGSSFGNDDKMFFKLYIVDLVNGWADAPIIKRVYNV